MDHKVPTGEENEAAELGTLTAGLQEGPGLQALSWRYSGHTERKYTKLPVTSMRKVLKYVLVILSQGEFVFMMFLVLREHDDI